jgi:competence protein ComEA
MEAAPSPVAVAAASPPAPAEWPDATRWVAPPGDLSVRLPAGPAPTWPRSAQTSAALLLVLLLGLLGWHVCAARRWSCRPATLEADALALPGIDLNQADHAQLLQLPGVGDSLARRIEDYRVEHHGFRDVEELRRISGIGPKMLEKLRPHVYVEPLGSDEEGEPEAVPVRRTSPLVKTEKPPPIPSKKIGALTQPIDINQAPEAELRLLPGIGPKLSQRIIEARDKKPFASVDELRRVPGIGPKTLQRLRPHVAVVP